MFSKSKKTEISGTIGDAVPLLYIPSLARCKLGKKQTGSSSSQASESFLDEQNLYHHAGCMQKGNSLDYHKDSKDKENP